MYECIKLLWDTIMCNTYKIHSPVSFHQQRKLHSRLQYDNTVCVTRMSHALLAHQSRQCQVIDQKHKTLLCNADITQRYNYTCFKKHLTNEEEMHKESFKWEACFILLCIFTISTNVFISRYDKSHASLTHQARGHDNSCIICSSIHPYTLFTLRHIQVPVSVGTSKSSERTHFEYIPETSG